MTKKILLLPFLFGWTFGVLSDELEFSKVDRAALGSLLFDEIERLDASAIFIRNKTKTVKWPEYRAEMQNRFASAHSKEALARAIDQSQQGFTTAHGAIQPYSTLFDVRLLYKNAPDKRGLNIGFTYPNARFFSLQTKEWISHINGIDLHKRFEHFEQFECQFAHQNACLEKFVKQIKFGWASLGIKDEVSFTSPDGVLWTEKVIAPEAKISRGDQVDSEYCSTYAADYPSWKLNFAGGNVCLLRKGEYSLLRIHKFGEWGSSQEDFYCEREAKASTLCHDVQAVSKNLSLNKHNKIIVDLQDNFGGSENTPVLSLLSPSQFRNGLVKFRFTSEMLHTNFREKMFYDNPHAMNWWTTLVENKQVTQLNSNWLPVRTDFCRGDSQCNDVVVPRRGPAIAIKQIIVVVNSGCFSSCDDLVWRLKRDAKAIVIGQPPVTDSKYASATGIIYMTPKGELKSKVLAPGQASEIPPEMTKLLWFKVPYTATMTDNNEFLDGDSSVIDKLIPINRENFANIRSQNVNAAISYINGLTRN